MKKLVAMLFAAAIIYSCGDDSSKNESEGSKPADTAGTTTAPAPAAPDAAADNEKASFT